MCNLIGYKCWQEIFDESVSKVWSQEPVHILKNISMLYYSIDREIKKIQDTLNSDISGLRSLVNNTKFAPSDVIILSGNDNISPHEEIANIENELPTRPLKELSTNNNDSSSIIISGSEDEQCSANTKSIESSPEIHKKSSVFRRRLKRRQLIKVPKIVQEKNESPITNDVSMDTLKPTISTPSTNTTDSPKNFDSDMDVSIVQCTPVLKPKFLEKKDSFASRALKRKQQNSTLTQMFFTKTTKDKLSTSKSKLDATSSSGSNSMLGITNMVSYLNKETPLANRKQSISINFDDDSSSSLNSCMIEEANEEEDLNDLNDILAKAQSVPDQLEAAPVVRGKARQALPAWCCKECERFYTRQGLTVDEILALSKKCSRHRGKYRPREDTLPGFWDMNIITPDKDSL